LAAVKKFAVEGIEQSVFDSLLTVTSARDSLLAAAYTAERLAFTPENIRGVLRRSVLLPLDHEAMQRSCSEAVGVAAAPTAVHEEATAAAMKVIEACTPVALLKQHAARGAAAAARVANRAKKDAEKELQQVENEADRVRKAATKKSSTCRACQERTHRSCGRWADCPCGGY